MSRIGKMPVTIPSGVKVEWQAPVIKVTGGKTTLTRKLHQKISLDVSGNNITVVPADQSNEGRALWGLSRT